MRGLAALLALAAPAAAAPAPPANPISITYETQPCFGFCPVYRVTVNADGTGLFEGRRHTAVQGPRRFRLAPARFQAFARHLAPFRPARGEMRYDHGTRCQGAGPPPTDAPSADVTWRGPGGRTQSVHFYMGCRNQPIGDALVRAPRLLPIAGFIGPPCTRNCTR